MPSLPARPFLFGVRRRDDGLPRANLDVANKNAVVPPHITQIIIVIIFLIVRPGCLLNVFVLSISPGTTGSSRSDVLFPRNDYRNTSHTQSRIRKKSSRAAGGGCWMVSFKPSTATLYTKLGSRI